jgi:hypothetical protein
VTVEILKLDESCISNPKPENLNWTGVVTVQSEISDFGFEMQDSSNFKISDFWGRVESRERWVKRPPLLCEGNNIFD